jgi:hypothetical protein
MRDRFSYPKDDVLDMLDALLAGRGGAWWNEFFEDRTISLRTAARIMSNWCARH